REIAEQFPIPDLKARTRYTMAGELAHEIFYNLMSYIFHLVYPRYVADRYYNPIVEYLVGIPKQLRMPRMDRKAGESVARLVREKRRYYLMPLQLQCDYQLRHNARFRHQSEAIRDVVASFAAHAPKEASLVLKCHPLDNGGENWPRHIKAVANEVG